MENTVVPIPKIVDVSILYGYTQYEWVALKATPEEWRIVLIFKDGDPIGNRQRLYISTAMYIAACNGWYDQCVERLSSILKHFNPGCSSTLVQGAPPQCGNWEDLLLWASREVGYPTVDDNRSHHLS